jgi:hypothetical protein
MFSHEAQGQPVPKDESVIVEAFGDRKCPKLIEQVMSDNPVTRRNALSVLCDEMHNPMSVQGCVEAGMVQVLNNYIAKSEDPPTKELASRALSIVALDANGRTAMLEENTAGEVVPGIDDVDVNVRANLYEALVNFTRGPIPCLHSVIAAKYASTLVGKAAIEVPEVQPFVLKLLYNCIREESGLDDVLGAGGVRTCIGLLSSKSVDVRKEAATTLAFLCFTEAAKQDAIKGGAVPLLVGLLPDGGVPDLPDAAVQSAACAALVSITTTDEGKMAIVPAEGTEPIIALLASCSKRNVKLTLLKLIANVVVHPQVREQMRHDDRVLPTLDEWEAGEEDTLIAKHACIAKAAVLWEP